MLLLFVVILLAILIYFYFTRKTTKHIYFVGPRGSGKTYTLYYLLYKKPIATIPSLEDNEVKYKKYIIHDIIEKKGKTFNEIYSISTTDKYFFFFSTDDQLLDYEKGHDVTFVFVGKRENCNLRNELRDKLVCLENEPERMRNLIEKV